MKTPIIYTALLFVGLAATIVSCNKTPTISADICNGIGSKWSTSVNALVQTKCATAHCHDGSVAGGTFTTRLGIKDNADNALKAIYNKSMPQSSVSITETERNQIMCWLQDGCPDN